MTSKQYLASLKRLGLTHQAAGRMLGVSPRHAQRFAAGETPIPGPVARLLWLMEYNGLTEDDLTKAIERREFSRG